LTEREDNLQHLAEELRGAVPRPACHPPSANSRVGLGVVLTARALCFSVRCQRRAVGAQGQTGGFRRRHQPAAGISRA
jgi:hypothetical protein